MAPHQNQKANPIFQMLFACACFSMMGAVMNYGCSRLSPAQLIFSRGLIDSLIVIPILLSKNVRLFGNNPWKLFTRGTLGVCGASCIFWATLHMPMANAAALFRTTPLFMPFFAYFLLKEKLIFKNILLSVFGFVGVLLILKPQAGYAVSYAGLIALTGALFNTLSFVTVRHLASRENALCIMLYFFVLSVFYPALATGSSFIMPIGNEWTFVLIMGSLGFLGQYFVTMSLKNASAGTVTPWTYSEIVFSAVFAYLMLGQTADFFALAGALIIFISAINIQPTASSARPGI
jgi:drug/metabolite transporter (DMT)-like permease